MPTEKMARKKKRITKEGWFLLMLCVPFIVYIFMFTYVTLFGWIYAFVDFRPGLGVNPFIHEFVGLRNFRQLFAERNDLIRVVRNTLAMSGLSLLMMPLTPLLAIFFMELRSTKLKRVTQTVTTFPNFISWIIVYGIAFSFFSNQGVFASFRELLGLEAQSLSLIANVDRVWSFQTMLGVWKGIGWGAIIYVAAIAGIDESLYEAARIDGASRIRCIRHVTIPGISGTFLVMFLLAVSGILAVDLERQLVFFNSMVAYRLQGIDHYVYRIGIAQNQFSFAIAVGIVRSFIGIGLLFGANFVAKLIRGESLI
jgi:ABC-type polysaccharide transport system permease subunit